MAVSKFTKSPSGKEITDKINEIIDNSYVHPTTSGNKHIPSGGASGNILGWDSDGTAKWITPTDNDTKNTAGSTDTSSKIFLIGATSQAANPQTYSHDTVFVDTDGALNSPTVAQNNSSTKVATTAFVNREYMPIGFGRNSINKIPSSQADYVSITQRLQTDDSLIKNAFIASGRRNIFANIDQDPAWTISCNKYNASVFVNGAYDHYTNAVDTSTFPTDPCIITFEKNSQIDCTDVLQLYFITHGLANYTCKKSIKIEVKYTNDSQWYTVRDFVDTNLGDFATGLFTTQLKASLGVSTNYIPISGVRVTISKWADAYFQLAEIELRTGRGVDKACTAVDAVSKRGDTLYGGLTPIKDNTYNLGTSSNKWASIYATTFNGNASTATTASKLGTTDVGSATQGIYLDDGVAKACTYTVAKSVPSDAVFTDTVYTHPTTSGNKHIPSGGSSGQILKYSADGTATWANEYSYTHPTTSGNKHIPSGGSSGQILKWSADGTATWANEYSYTHPTTSGNKHIPSGGSSGQLLGWSADGTAAWKDNTSQYWVKKTIDLSNTSTYLETTWYPVTGTSLQGADMRRILVDVELNSGTKPSWSTHNSGFSVILDMFAIGSGWGTTTAASVCLQQSASWVSDASTPPASFSQMTNSSTPVLWLRGGGKYFVWTNYECTWTPRTETYTASNQSVTPTTTYPVLSFNKSTIWANLNGNATSASSASVATRVDGGTLTDANVLDLVKVKAATNDFFRIRAGGTAANAGYVEIATADDGNEPIYVRQYTGEFATVTRTATLLDGSGNTSFPGTVTASSFSGNATSATTATKLGSTTVGGTTTPIYLNNGTPTALSYTIAKSVPSDAVFTDTVYTHPTTSGNKHIPSGGSSGQILKWSSDGTATWAAEYSYTHPTTSGSKHIPSGGSSGQFLKWSADGTATWAADNDTKNTAGSTDTSSKIFLVGATSQAANPQTYSHDTVFVDTDGMLNSVTPTAGNSSTKVATTAFVGTALGSYLPKSGGTMTGGITFANNTWNSMGDDASIGDHNVGGHICIKPNNSTYDNSGGIQFCNSSGTSLAQLNASSGALTSSGSIGVSNNAAKMQYNSTTEAIEFVFA